MRLSIDDLKKPFSCFWLVSSRNSIHSISSNLSCYDGKNFVVWATYTNHRGIKVETKEQAVAAARWLNNHRRKFLSKQHMHDLCGDCCKGIQN